MKPQRLITTFTEELCSVLRNYCMNISYACRHGIYESVSKPIFVVSVLQVRLQSRLGQQLACSSSQHTPRAFCADKKKKDVGLLIIIYMKRTIYSHHISIAK